MYKLNKKMEEFKYHNLKYKIVKGERLTPDGRPIHTKEDHESSDRARYTFEDGSVRTILDKDKDFSYAPIWK